MCVHGDMHTCAARSLCCLGLRLGGVALHNLLIVLNSSYFLSDHTLGGFLQVNDWVD